MNHTIYSFHRPPLSLSVSYAYNNLGLRTQMTDGTGTSRYSYDSLNRPITTTDGVGKTITYTYDLGSRLTGITYPYNGSSVRTVTEGTTIPTASPPCKIGPVITPSSGMMLMGTLPPLVTPTPLLLPWHMTTPTN